MRMPRGATVALDKPFSIESLTRMSLRTRSLAAALSIAVALAACGRQDARSAGSAATPRRIAVIPKGTTHEFWKSIHAGAVKAARAGNAEVIWKGPVREDDRDEQ